MRFLLISLVIDLLLHVPVHGIKESDLLVLV